MRATTWTKLLRNICGQYLTTVVSLVTGLALVPFTVRHIGLANFGLWALVNGLFGTMGLLDAGLSPTLTKKSAELLASNDEATLKETASRILTLYLLAGLIGFVLVAGLAVLPNNIFHITPDSMSTFRAIMLIVALQLAVSFPLSTWSGITAGLQDFHFTSGVVVVVSIVKFAATIVLLKLGFGLISLIWLGLAATCFSGGAHVIWVNHRLPRLKLRASISYLNRLGELTRFSGSMFIWGIAGRVVMESDRIIIGLFLPMTSVGVYEIGLRICNYSRNVLYPVFAFLPAASDLSARDDKEQLRSLYLIGTKYFFLAYSFVAGCLFLFGGHFIHLWMGPGFETSILVLFVLLLGNIYQSQNIVAHVLLPGMGKLRAFTWIMVSYPILNVTLSVVFIKLWGVVGVALATTATYFLAETLFIYFIARTFEVTIFRILVSCHLPVLAIVAPGLLTGYYFKSLMPQQSWPALVAGVLMVSVTCAVAFITYGVSGSERNRILAAAARLIPRPA